MFLLYLLQIRTPGNHFCNQNLLVDPFHQHLLIDRLILSSKEIMVEIQIQVQDRLYKRKRLVGKQIVHIKRMPRQAYA